MRTVSTTEEQELLFRPPLASDLNKQFKQSAGVSSEHVSLSI